jgi:hypothetical protein
MMMMMREQLLTGFSGPPWTHASDDVHPLVIRSKVDSDARNLGWGLGLRRRLSDWQRAEEGVAVDPSRMLEGHGGFPALCSTSSSESKTLCTFTGYPNDSFEVCQAALPPHGIARQDRWLAS